MKHLIAPTPAITPAMREAKNGHRSGVLWFTGLSGAGKSTLAQALERELFSKGWQVVMLDGDHLRGGLCRDLGFSPAERTENVRRAACVARLMADAGFLVLASFITPLESDRATAREAIGERYKTVYVKADLATCEARDVKGLYKLARQGKIPEFTGISAPYEVPADAQLTIDTATKLDACVAKLLDYVQAEFALQPEPVA